MDCVYNPSYKCYKSQVYTDYCLQSPQTVSEHAATNIVLTVRNHELWDRKLNEVERQSSWERSTFELSSVQHINGVGKRSSNQLMRLQCDLYCSIWSPIHDRCRAYCAQWSNNPNTQYETQQMCFQMSAFTLVFVCYPPVW